MIGAAGSVLIGIFNLFWAVLAHADWGELAPLVALWLALVAYWLSTTRRVAQVVITREWIEARGAFGWWPRRLRWGEVRSVGIEPTETLRGVALSLILTPAQGGSPMRIGNQMQRFADLSQEARGRVARAQRRDLAD